MCYFARLVKFLLYVSFTQSQDTGQVTLYSESYFQGYTQAYPFVAASCLGSGNGFPARLNVAIGSLRTDHAITLHPFQDCKGDIKVILGAGSYPDLPSYLRSQNSRFKTVTKSISMLPYQQDNVQLFSRLDGPQDQNAVLLLTVLTADIDHATPCFKFNDNLSTQIGGVDNHLNCLVFFTDKDCEGRKFKVDAQEKLVGFPAYQPNQTYYGMKLCGNDVGVGKEVGILKTANVKITTSKNNLHDNSSANLYNPHSTT